MPKYSKQLKNECLKLFIGGPTLKEISKLKNIPFQTIHTWHARYNWSKAKSENETKVKQEIQKEVLADTKKEYKTVLQREQETEAYLVHIIESSNSQPNEKIGAARALTASRTLQAKITRELVEKQVHEHTGKNYDEALREVLLKLKENRRSEILPLWMRDKKDLKVSQKI
jgi:hypothetical protein